LSTTEAHRAIPRARFLYY